jgi:hypothetical protein
LKGSTAAAEADVETDKLKCTPEGVLHLENEGINRQLTNA